MRERGGTDGAGRRERVRKGGGMEGERTWNRGKGGKGERRDSKEEGRRGEQYLASGVDKALYTSPSPYRVH